MLFYPLPIQSVAIFCETRYGVRPISGAKNQATAMAFGGPRSSCVRPGAHSDETPGPTASRGSGVVALRSSLTLPRFPVLLHSVETRGVGPAHFAKVAGSGKDPQPFLERGHASKMGAKRNIPVSRLEKSQNATLQDSQSCGMFPIKTQQTYAITANVPPSAATRCTALLRFGVGSGS